MADINKVIELEDGTLTNLVDTGTKLSVNYKLVTSWYDGTPMNDIKCDGELYRKKGNKYYRKVIDKEGELFLEKDTVVQLRAITPYEILLLKASVFKGVRLNGYYTKGDTLTSIDYFLYNGVEEDDGGSVFEINNIKVKHDFTKVDIRYFGISKNNNGDDNTTKMLNLLDYIKVTKIPILSDGFTYQFNAFKNINLDFEFTLIGNSTTFNFNSEGFTEETIFNVNTNYINVDGVIFKNCGKVFNPSDSTVEYLNWTVSNCIFENSYAPVWFANSWESPIDLKTVFNINWNNNKILNCYFGACFVGVNYSDRINFSNNFIKGIKKQAGFRAGEDNINKRSNIKNITVNGNTILDVNTEGTESNRGVANGIAVFCRSAVIQGNTIENISTSYGADNEGIYGKAEDVVCSSNIVRNTISSNGEGGINFKGSYRLLITDNVIHSCFRGINLASATGEVIVTGNYISDFTNSGIYHQQAGFPKNVKISGNIITNSALGSHGIVYRGWGDGAEISNNIITNIANPLSTGSGIYVHTQFGAGDTPATELNRYSSKNINIQNNLIKDIGGAEGSCIRIYGLGSFTDISNVLISNNNLINCVSGVRLSSGSTSTVSDIDINLNKYTNITNRLRVLTAEQPYITNINSNDYINGVYAGEFKTNRINVNSAVGGANVATFTRTGISQYLYLRSATGNGLPFIVGANTSNGDKTALSIMIGDGSRAGYIGIGVTDQTESLEVGNNLKVRGDIIGTIRQTNVSSSNLTFVTNSFYGTVSSPIIGSITADITGAKLGVTNTVIHRSANIPTFDSKFKKISISGDYIINQTNYIQCTYVNDTEIIYTIYQIL